MPDGTGPVTLKVTGLSNEPRIPSHVLPDVPEASLRRMRPDILLFEKSPDDSLPMSVQRLEHADNRRSCKVHVIEVGFCTEISYFQKFKEKSEQHSLLLEHLRIAGYAEVQLHLMICLTSISDAFGSCPLKGRSRPASPA